MPKLFGCGDKFQIFSSVQSAEEAVCQSLDAATTKVFFSSLMLASSRPAPQKITSPGEGEGVIEEGRSGMALPVQWEACQFVKQFYIITWPAPSALPASLLRMMTGKGFLPTPT